MSDIEITIRLSDDQLGSIAEAVAERLRSEALDELSLPRYLTREQAASYMGWKVSALEKNRSIPFTRPTGGRCVYDRYQLDAYMRGEA